MEMGCNGHISASPQTRFLPHLQKNVNHSSSFQSESLPAERCILNTSCGKWLAIQSSSCLIDLTTISCLQLIDGLPSMWRTQPSHHLHSRLNLTTVPTNFIKPDCAEYHISACIVIYTQPSTTPLQFSTIEPFMHISLPAGCTGPRGACPCYVGQPHSQCNLWRCLGHLQDAGRHVSWRDRAFSPLVGHQAHGPGKCWVSATACTTAGTSAFDRPWGLSLLWSGIIRLFLGNVKRVLKHAPLHPHMHAIGNGALSAGKTGLSPVWSGITCMDLGTVG